MSELSGGTSAMSRQFFPEHQKCRCCRGYIYGCEGKSCKSLGHCVCTTMKTGHALGATKKRAGKYEIIKSPEQLPHPETWPILWIFHLKRCYVGSFMDKRLASHAERRYLGNQLKMDPHDSSEAFSLLAWRKSVLYVMLFLCVCIVCMDVVSVKKEFDYWGYLGEMSGAPMYHGISGLPPYNIDNTYMSEEARIAYRLPSPDTWTTLTGHIRDKNSGLCMGSLSVFKDADSALGSNLALKRCSADGDVQWLIGSDHGTYTYTKQVKLNAINAYASVDPFTQAPTAAPTPGPLWRSDQRCGPNLHEDATLDPPVPEGTEVPCDGTSQTHGCCNRDTGYCGTGENFCTCEANPTSCCNYQDFDTCPNRRILDELESESNSDSAPSPSFYFPGENEDMSTRSLTSSKEPGFSINSLSSPIGICLNGYNSGYSLNIDLCTSNAMQGFEFDSEGIIRSEQWKTQCIMVKENGPLTFALNAKLYLRPCDDSDYVAIKWNIPNDNSVKLSLLEPDKKTNVDVITTTEPCSYLTKPKSANWWPTYASQDEHKECLKFSQTSTDTGYESTVRYKVGGLGFTRFQAHVGMADATEAVGKVNFEVNLCVTENSCYQAAEIVCQAQELSYGTQANFSTSVTRNLCKFVDCEPASLEAVFNSDADHLCWAPYAPVDVIIADQTYIELVVRSPRACFITEYTDEEGVLRTVSDCGGRQWASWASPRLANAVRDGEEGIIDYTHRMLWGMHAAIFEPCWIIFIGMDASILFIDFFCAILVFWSLWYWAAYKRSRGKMFTAWALTFVGPLLISCIPVRLFIPWDKAQDHIAAYLLDFERRYNLETVEDMVLETCKTYSAGYGDAGLKSLIGTATTLCAKKGVVPPTCSISTTNNYPEDDPCYHYYDIGGALQWAEQVNPPEVSTAQYSDFIYVSPTSRVQEGFPHSCFDIFSTGVNIFSDVCYDTSTGFFPDTGTADSSTTDNPMPCKGLTEQIGGEGFDCNLGGNLECELTGYCRMPAGNGAVSTVSCANLYKAMNCTDVAKYYSDYCECSCAVKVDTDPFSPGGSGDDHDIPDWYYDNEWCFDGMVETAIPKINRGQVWIPFKGNTYINTYPIHTDCGEVRGFLYEGKFDQAAEAVRVMCDGLIEDYDSSSVSAMDRVMEGVESLLEYASQMAGISASVYNAFTMFRLALPVALCIGPALLRGALRTKLLVPQSATPGLFIQLLPWLYCPIVWCLFNFIFQLIGNHWLLPGLLLLAYIPMVYFIVGIRQEISKPMTKQSINLVIFWLDIFTLFASILAYVLLAYGVYYTLYLDPNSQMLSLLITEVAMQECEGGFIECTPWPIIMIIVFTITKIIFKYTATTVTGVDFMMYELIQQRFYEMFLEKGDATAQKLQEARANRLDAFCKLIAESTSAQMSRSTTKSAMKRASMASKKSRGRSSIKSRGSDGAMMSRTSSGGTDGGGSNGSRNGSKSRQSDFGVRESSFAASSVSDRSHIVPAASIKQVLKKNALVWDLINNGQPRLKMLPRNTLNAIFTTPLHLKRSRSKLEILKKMASKSEVAYLSKKLGLTHTPDSAICYELMVWRRSALWTLILFGAVATYFAIAQINQDYLNAGAYYDMATNAPLHRFPKPHYLEEYSFEHFGLDDPELWTVYSGPVITNATLPGSVTQTNYKYLSLSGTKTEGVGIPLGLVPTYDYSKPYMQWSLEPINGTLRNEAGMCVGTESGLGSKIVTKGCINDFLRDKAAIVKDQVWQYDATTKALKNGNGLCMGRYTADIPLVQEPKDGLIGCGPANPLINGDPGQCDGTQNAVKCCNTKERGDYQWDGNRLIDVASTCGGTDSYCRCSTCLDYSGANDIPEANRPTDWPNPTRLTNIPLVATTCGSNNMLRFDLPDENNVEQRLDSWCNDKNVCIHANSSKMYALYDYGVNFLKGDSDIRWRCYAEQTLKDTYENGKRSKAYDTSKGGLKYCDLHTSITALLERAQGREEFNTYMKRMVKVGYARMMAEAESAMISINALLILLAWGAIVLAYLGFHLYSRYKLSRSLVIMGWFCTFLAPFLLSMIPLRLFIRWERSQVVQDAMLMEFRDHYELNSKETAIIDTCNSLEGGEVDGIVTTILDMCAYNTPVPQKTAHEWGDSSMNTEEAGAYLCTGDYGAGRGVDGDGNRDPNKGKIEGQTGSGYPAVPKMPCAAIESGNGQAWIDQGSYVCNNSEDCDCPEDDPDCEAVKEQEGVPMSLDEWREFCENNTEDSLPPVMLNGYVAWFFQDADGDPVQIDAELMWPASIWVSQVKFDVVELLTTCGQARRNICLGDYNKALNNAKAVCAEINAYIDDDVGTDAPNIESVMELLMKSVKETSEIGISLIHSVKSFKIMSSATFALAPALIRAAIRVKTAVPQNSISGMFVIILPWLYSPLVWCVYNLVFQVIGNWQLLVGLIIMAYGPVAFFIVGVWKDITRPMPDKEIHIIRLIMTILGRAKIFFGMIFVCWGLYDYAFEEQAKYTSEYKSYLMKDFSTMAMMELGANIVMKYYYTTVVGVDYMLSQILSSRRYEVYMQMASEDNMWKNSKAAKRAAELKEHYVTLMNKFCHMAGLSTADLPAFSHYRAHKLRKKRKEKARKIRKEASKKGKKSKLGFWGQVFSRPPDRTEGVPDFDDRTMNPIAEEDDDEEQENGVELRPVRSHSGFEQENPMSKAKAKGMAKVEREKQKKKEELEQAVADRGEDWQLATDPQTGKQYMYNTITGESEWLPKAGDAKKKKVKKAGGEVGKAVAMDDAALLDMLKKPPKDVPEIHSKDAFRKFFNGFPRDRIESLLTQANAGKSEEEIAKKVGKRMKVLDGVLV